MRGEGLCRGLVAAESALCSSLLSASSRKVPALTTDSPIRKPERIRTRPLDSSPTSTSRARVFFHHRLRQIQFCGGLHRLRCPQEQLIRLAALHCSATLTNMSGRKFMPRIGELQPYFQSPRVQIELADVRHCGSGIRAQRSLPRHSHLRETLQRHPVKTSAITQT